ncbi:MAG: hypothetical protein JXL80_17910 [Planctomycetes bacterium]|nr:hypothetical protein [Planctomycetota bacterium]
MTEVKSLPVARKEFEAQCQFPCLLCGQAAITTGLYFPSPTSPIAPPEGKIRAILYGLCDDCFGQYKKLLPTIETLIEQQMMAALKKTLEASKGN